MTSTREWPAGVLCVILPDLPESVEAYVVRRPTTYQNLMATAASLFRGRFDEAADEMYIKTNDFGLEWPVEVLPDVWEMPEVHGFLRSVEIHTRMRGEGPSQADPVNADRTQATIPPSPSASPPPYVPGRAPVHSTPANRRANTRQPTDGEPVSGGYRGHDNDEADQPEPESSRNVRSRMSLQAHASNDNPRPIRTIRVEPTNEEIMPSSSQEADATADGKIYVEVRHEAESVMIKVRPQKTFASLFKTACNHFKLDKDTIKLFQMVAFDGRDSISPMECNLTATLGEGNIADDDVFFLLPYDGDY